MVQFYDKVKKKEKGRIRSVATLQACYAGRRMLQVRSARTTLEVRKEGHTVYVQSGPTN